MRKPNTIYESRKHFRRFILEKTWGLRKCDFTENVSKFLFFSINVILYKLLCG